jgi:hypothetical protein
MVHVSSGYQDRWLDCSDIKTPINNLWSDFKTICLDNLRKHVPSKHTSTRYSQPWCNHIRYMMIYILFESISVVGDIGPSLSFFLFSPHFHLTHKTAKLFCNIYDFHHCIIVINTLLVTSRYQKIKFKQHRRLQ